MKEENKKNIIWRIIKRCDGRYVIVESTTGIVLHDGQYGFKSYESAYNFGINQYHTEPEVNVEYKVYESNKLF